MSDPFCSMTTTSGPRKFEKSHLRHETNPVIREKMFKSRVASWGFTKNISKRDALLAREYIVAYRAKHGGSPTEVVLDGRVIPTEKVQKHLRRLKCSGTLASAELESLATSSSTNIRDGLDNSRSSRNTDCFGGHLSSDETGELDTDNSDDVVVTNRKSRGISISDLIEHSLPEHEKLTAEELSTLYVAILQTDFHLRDPKDGNQPQDNLASQNFRTNKRSSHSFSPRLRIFALDDLPEFRDIGFALHQTNIYYEHLADTRNQHSEECWTLSSRQKTQARDFYARYWVSLTSLDGGKWGTAFNLIDRAHDQVGDIIEEDHPHFLTWMCFVVCYPYKISWILDKLQVVVLDFACEMTRLLLGPQNPRSQIQHCLASSNWKKNICLALLKRIVDIFRQETQDSHLEELKLLAKLFDSVDKIDDNNVEEMLAHWASVSHGIAQVIREDQRTQEMKAKRGRRV